MIELAAWQKIVLYLLLLLSLYIFVKTSQIKINNKPILKLKYRILIAVFFPVIFALAFIAGSIIIGIATVAIAVVIFSSYLNRKKERSIKREIVIRKI